MINQIQLIVKGAINKCCPICMDPLQADIKNNVTIFRCRHAVHANCARNSQHLLKFQTCPLCRGDLKRVNYLVVDKYNYDKFMNLFHKFDFCLIKGKKHEDIKLQHWRDTEIVFIDKKELYDKQKMFQIRNKLNQVNMIKTQKLAMKQIISYCW